MCQRLSLWQHINNGTIDNQNSASLVDFELIIAIESQTLRASEIQQRYKNPVFTRFSSLLQYPQMSF